MTYLVGATLIALLFLAPLLGLFLQPFSPWWLGQRATVAPVPGGVVPIGPLPQITDEQRYAFATAAGWSDVQAITATAISIAENGSGDPAALSGVNHDGSRDLGLWQINSGWWSRFGGMAALIDPATNARAGYAIYLMQHWCAWSTYGPCPTHPCGPPCFQSFMDRAERAANGVKHQ